MRTAENVGRNYVLSRLIMGSKAGSPSLWKACPAYARRQSGWSWQMLAFSS